MHTVATCAQRYHLGAGLEYLRDIHPDRSDIATTRQLPTQPGRLRHRTAARRDEDDIERRVHGRSFCHSSTSAGLSGDHGSIFTTAFSNGMKCSDNVHCDLLSNKTFGQTLKQAKRKAEATNESGLQVPSKPSAAFHNLRLTFCHQGRKRVHGYSKHFKSPIIKGKSFGISTGVQVLLHMLSTICTHSIAACCAA